MNTLTTSTAITSGTVATPAPKTVLENMPARSLFNDHDSAANFIAKCQNDFADFDNYPVIPVGMTVDDEGAIVFDSAIYDDTMQIAVVKLSERGNAEKKIEGRVKAIVIYPSPSVESITTSPVASDWLAGLIAKEINHVAVRNLRKASNAAEMAEALESMPTKLEDYTTSTTETTGGIVETYNTLWQAIKAGIGQKSKAFRLRAFSKKEMKRAMESASYALALYPECEDRKLPTGKTDSAFVRAILFGKVMAAEQGLDQTIFDRMLAQRDEKKIDATTDDDESDDFDFEAMAKALAKPATPAADATTTGEPAALVVEPTA